MTKGLFRWSLLAVALAATACTVQETGVPLLTGPSEATGSILPVAVAPTARFTFLPNTGTANSPVAFDGTLSCAGTADPASTNPCPSTGGLVSYVWNFGDGTSGTGATVTHTFPLQRTYNVTLTVTNTGGLSSTTAHGVPIGGGLLPTAAFTVSPTNPVVGQDVFVNGATSVAGGGHVIASYSWDFGDGSKKSGLTAAHDYGSSGTFTIVLTVIDENGQSASATRTVTVGTGAPTAVIAFAVTDPAAHKVTFDGSASTAVGGATIANYIWSFGDGTNGSGAITSRSYSVAATYTVTLTVTDNLGRTGVTSQSITVP
jgi:PKD repeat protein